MRAIYSDRRGFIAAAAIFALMPIAASAQSWPTRPVTMIVPFPAGGPADVLARVLAGDLSKQFGQQVVVDNRTGAGGNIGGAAVAKAAPDGYTILFGTPGPLANNKIMYKKPAYDPQKDLTPVVLIAKSPLIIVANPNTPAKNLKELIAYAKANPGKLNIGVPGNGTLGHITSELVQKTAGAKMTNVPYRGTAPLMNDLLSGQLNGGMDFMTTYVPLVKAGKLRALAVTSAKRSDLLPDVPTAQEQGMPGFEATAWYGIAAPAGTPAAVINKINAATNKFLQSKEGQATMAKFGMQAAGGTPDALKDFVASELAKWGPIVKAANIAL